MKRVLIGLVAIVCALSISAAPIDATVRKCGSGTVVPMRGLPSDTTIYLMIDGKVVGPLLGGDYDGVARTFRTRDGEMTIADRDLLRLGVSCIISSDTVRSVIAVVTKSGAIPAVEADLRALAVAQENYRELSGAYTADLRTLRLFDDRNPTLPISVTLTENGWSAIVEVATTSCRVGTGPAGLPPGEVSCTAP